MNFPQGEKKPLVSCCPDAAVQFSGRPCPTLALGEKVRWGRGWLLGHTKDLRSHPVPSRTQLDLRKAALAKNGRQAVLIAMTKPAEVSSRPPGWSSD